MKYVRPLDYHRLTNRCDPQSFPFETSAELTDDVEYIGQKRATEAIHFGITVKHDGYNLYALGPEEIGKKSIVESILKQESSKKATPPDWCYVYNFHDPRCPLRLMLPPGMGKKLQAHMNKLIENLKETLPAIFDTEEHHARIKQINKEVDVKQKAYFDTLQEEAERNEMTILSTSKGFVVVPIKDEKVLTEKDLQLLSESERDEKDELTEELNEDLRLIIDKIQKLQKKRVKEEKIYERDFTLDAIGPFFDRLMNKYSKYSQVTHYLEQVKKDVVENVKIFLKNYEEPPLSMWGESHPSEFAFSRYQVNVIVDNSHIKGAPIIYLDNARYYELFGRIEHVSQFGALVTDFSLIRQGALHRANGGYLLMHANNLLDETLSWEALKNALLTKQINIKLPPTMISVTSTSTLEPEPIPLDIKIILLGNRADYYYLRDTDTQFNDLFKVAVDFEESVTRDEVILDLFPKMIATQARKLGLKPFDRKAIARIVDHSSRLMEDAEKILLNMRSLINLLEEADHWAEVSGRETITDQDIQHTINRQIFRLDHYQQLLYEEIERDILFINTEGEAVSQINALTTYRFGEFTFGLPSRITATAAVGREGIIDIEREVQLSGPIHSKGMLILSGFFRGRYALKWPLTLSASIVFEQSYSEVDGDSASVAELCSLLSALSNIPIQQNLAVTGSINQLGLVQAIGNVNEKIEGFFDICCLRGLTGNQGVVIPRTNVKNLMLKHEVIDAARANQFNIYPVENIDQAIFLLMGIPAGERDRQGKYPKGTINALVEEKLKSFVKLNRKWARDV